MKTSKLFFLMFMIVINSKLSAQDGSQYVGQIAWVSFTFVPTGWAECNGALLPIQQNTALFALLGTQYGGNGTTNFALPDLRGRTLIGSGDGPGLTPQSNGEMTGENQTTLNILNLPSHNHSVKAVKAVGNKNMPGGNLPANTGDEDQEYSTATPDTTFSAQAIQPSGSGQAHNNMQPYGTLKCIIALNGVFPQRP